MSDSVECIPDDGVCLLGEYHSSYSQWQKRPGALLLLLQPSDVLRCMWRQTQLCHYPVLFCVVFDQGRRALVPALSYLLLQSLFRYIIRWSLEHHSAG